jgi:hypothetical protein
MYYDILRNAEIFNFQFSQSTMFSKRKERIFWNILEYSFVWQTGKWNLQILFIDLVIFKLING